MIGVLRSEAELSLMICVLGSCLVRIGVLESKAGLSRDDPYSGKRSRAVS